MWVNQLSITKRDRVLFDNLTFSVDAGQLLYIKGPNGAGKTSLLRVLAGLSAANSGDVIMNSTNVSSSEASPSHTHSVSNTVYFGHKLGINSMLSPVENLQFWCQCSEITVTKNQIYDVLAKLSLVGLEDVPVSNLSAGQQRRTALARFWLQPNASLWIMDEPFTALDVEGVSVLSEHIHQFLCKGGAVIMTSHQSLDIAYPTTELQLEYRH